MPTLKGQFELVKAEEIANKIVKAIKPCCSCITVCGSIRRKKAIIGDIDIIAADITDKGLKVFEDMCDRIELSGSRKVSAIVAGLPVDINFMPLETWGAALMYATGPKEENMRLRIIAKNFNYKLSEYGLVDRETGELIAGETEEGVYEALGLPFLKPEER